MTRRARARPLRAAPPPARLSWSHRARADLEAIGDYIARDDAAAAERWVMRIIAAAEKVVPTPLRGRRVPEVSRDDVREVLLRSYRIVYRVSPGQIQVLTVFEGHRLIVPTDE